MYMLICGGCAPSELPRPASAPPAIERPAQTLPADLDVVVRVDVARIRQALGPSVVLTLKEQAAAVGPGGALDAIVRAAIEQTDTLWVGFRPGDSARTSDSVWVLRGRFSGLDLRAIDRSWSSQRPLGGVWYVAERASDARAEPVRAYVRRDDLLVLVSAAEVDAVERVLERGVRGPALQPKEHGTFSVSARPQRLAEHVRDRSPAAARFLGSARLLDATCELTHDELRLEIGLQFEDEPSARRAAEAAGLLAAALIEQGDVPRAVAQHLDIESLSDSLVLRARVPLALLAKLSRK